jgi:hypothetical protein
MKTREKKKKKDFCSSWVTYSVWSSVLHYVMCNSFNTSHWCIFLVLMTFIAKSGYVCTFQFVEQFFTWYLQSLISLKVGCECNLSFWALNLPSIESACMWSCGLLDCLDFGTFESGVAEKPYAGLLQQTQHQFKPECVTYLASLECICGSRVPTLEKVFYLTC